MSNMDGETLKVIADLKVHSLQVSEKSEQALISIATSFESIAESFETLRKPCKIVLYCAGVSLLVLSSTLFMKTIFRIYKFSKGYNPKE